VIAAALCALALGSSDLTRGESARIFIERPPNYLTFFRQGVLLEIVEPFQARILESRAEVPDGIKPLRPNVRHAIFKGYEAKYPEPRSASGNVGALRATQFQRQGFELKDTITGNSFYLGRQDDALKCLPVLSFRFGRCASRNRPVQTDFLHSYKRATDVGELHHDEQLSVFRKINERPPHDPLGSQLSLGPKLKSTKSQPPTLKLNKRLRIARGCFVCAPKQDCVSNKGRELQNSNYGESYRVSLYGSLSSRILLVLAAVAASLGAVFVGGYYLNEDRRLCGAALITLGAMLFVLALMMGLYC
jgi:hypothetical protein